MRKFFTLALAAFASLSMWAALNNTTVTHGSDPQKYIDVKATASSDGDEVTVDGKYVAYTIADLITSDIKGVWYKQKSSSSGSSYTATVDFTGFRAECSKYMGFSSSKVDTIFVTNCVSVSVLYDPRGASRYVKLTAINVDDDTDKEEAQNSGDVASNTTYQADLEGLDPAKFYKVAIATTNGSDSRLFQIRLEAQVNTDGPFAITYDANGGEGTMTDANSPYAKNAEVTVLANAFTAPTGKIFGGWNTKAAGNGTAYKAGDKFAATADVKLFAQWVAPATGTGTVTYTMQKGLATVTGAVDGVSTLIASATEFTTSTLEIGTNNKQEGYCGQITGQQTDYSDDSYVSLGFKIAEGYTFAPSSVGITIKANTGDMKAKALISDGTTEIESEELICTSNADGTITFDSYDFLNAELKGDVTIKVFMWGVTGKRAYIKTPFTISGTVAVACTPAADPFKVTLDTIHVSDDEALFVGDKVVFKRSGGNGGTLTTYLSDGASFDDPDGSGDDKWTAIEGEHEIMYVQSENGGVCGARIIFNFVVVAKTPVTAAAISGSNKAFIDTEATLTCEAANATNWQWYQGGVAISGANEATYSFTPTAEGKLVFTCEAWNKFNTSENHAKSANFEVTVTQDICGILAKITATAKNAGTIEGEFAGTVSVSSDGTKTSYEGQTGYKLSGQGSHIGATFTDGTLKAGDKVLVFVTQVSDGKKLQIFSDKGTTLIAETDELKLGENIFVLDDRAEGGTGLFAYRTLGGTEGAQYNAHISTITLRRSCGNESNDASIKTLKINNEVVTAQDNVYSYEVPNDFGEQIEVVFELNDPNATADKTSPMQMLVSTDTNVENKQTITVTAEDGTPVTYTIIVTRAAAYIPSTDATIKELKFNGQPMTNHTDSFEYVVLADEDIKEMEITFTLAEKATADKTSPFKMAVPAPGADPTKEIINVTAEDGVTKNKYYVLIYKNAPDDEAIDNIGDGVQAVKFFENGQLVIIKNGIKYNAQGAIVK